MFPIDNVSLGTIFYGYSNAFFICPQIILYNFYLVLLVLMQYIYRRLCSLYDIYRPLNSCSFIGSYMVNCLLFCSFSFAVVTVDSLSHVFAATITYFQVFLFKILCNLCSLGKCFSIKFKNLLPTLVVTLLLNCGLNQIIFHFLCSLLVLFSILSTFGSVCSSGGWYPDFFNTSSYSGFTESDLFVGRISWK